ncbi:hypothetical protein DIPPA_32894 [Diplonema papillatum]|nr:hypothetical protein DIPPA_32894 [Diplonema papillatum]
MEDGGGSSCSSSGEPTGETEFSADLRRVKAPGEGAAPVAHLAVLFEAEGYLQAALRLLRGALLRDDRPAAEGLRLLPAHVCARFDPDADAWKALAAIRVRGVTLADTTRQLFGGFVREMLRTVAKYTGMARERRTAVRSADEDAAQATRLAGVLAEKQAEIKCRRDASAAARATALEKEVARLHELLRDRAAESAAAARGRRPSAALPSPSPTAASRMRGAAAAALGKTGQNADAKSSSSGGDGWIVAAAMDAGDVLFDDPAVAQWAPWVVSAVGGLVEGVVQTCETAVLRWRSHGAFVLGCGTLADALAVAAELAHASQAVPWPAALADHAGIKSAAALSFRVAVHFHHTPPAPGPTELPRSLFGSSPDRRPLFYPAAGGGEGSPPPSPPRQNPSAFSEQKSGQKIQSEPPPPDRGEAQQQGGLHRAGELGSSFRNPGFKKFGEGAQPSSGCWSSRLAGEPGSGLGSPSYKEFGVPEPAAQPSGSCCSARLARARAAAKAAALTVLAEPGCVVFSAAAALEADAQPALLKKRYPAGVSLLARRVVVRWGGCRDAVFRAFPARRNPECTDPPAKTHGRSGPPLVKTQAGSPRVDAEKCEEAPLSDAALWARAARRDLWCRKWIAGMAGGLGACTFALPTDRAVLLCVRWVLDDRLRALSERVFGSKGGSASSSPRNAVVKEFCRNADDWRHDQVVFELSRYCRECVEHGHGVELEADETIGLLPAETMTLCFAFDRPSRAVAAAFDLTARIMRSQLWSTLSSNQPPEPPVSLLPRTGLSYDVLSYRVIELPSGPETLVYPGLPHSCQSTPSSFGKVVEQQPPPPTWALAPSVDCWADAVAKAEIAGCGEVVLCGRAFAEINSLGSGRRGKGEAAGAGKSVDDPSLQGVRSHVPQFRVLSSTVASHALHSRHTLYAATALAASGIPATPATRQTDPFASPRNQPGAVAPARIPTRGSATAFTVTVAPWRADGLMRKNPELAAASFRVFWSTVSPCFRRYGIACLDRQAELHEPLANDGKSSSFRSLKEALAGGDKGCDDTEVFGDEGARCGNEPVDFGFSDGVAALEAVFGAVAALEHAAWPTDLLLHPEGCLSGARVGLGLNALLWTTGSPVASRDVSPATRRCFTEMSVNEVRLSSEAKLRIFPQTRRFRFDPVAPAKTSKKHARLVRSVESAGSLFCYSVHSETQGAFSIPPRETTNGRRVVNGAFDAEDLSGAEEMRISEATEVAAFLQEMCVGRYPWGDVKATESADSLVENQGPKQPRVFVGPTVSHSLQVLAALAVKATDSVKDVSPSAPQPSLHAQPELLSELTALRSHLNASRACVTVVPPSSPCCTTKEAVPLPFEATSSGVPTARLSADLEPVADTQRESAQSSNKLRDLPPSLREVGSWLEVPGVAHWLKGVRGRDDAKWGALTDETREHIARELRGMGATREAFRKLRLAFELAWVCQGNESNAKRSGRAIIAFTSAILLLLGERPSLRFFSEGRLRETTTFASALSRQYGCNMTEAGTLIAALGGPFDSGKVLLADLFSETTLFQEDPSPGGEVAAPVVTPPEERYKAMNPVLEALESKKEYYKRKAARRSSSGVPGTPSEKALPNHQETAAENERNNCEFSRGLKSVPSSAQPEPRDALRRQSGHGKRQTDPAAAGDRSIRAKVTTADISAPEAAGADPIHAKPERDQCEDPSAPGDDDDRSRAGRKDQLDKSLRRPENVSPSGITGPSGSPVCKGKDKSPEAPLLARTNDPAEPAVAVPGPVGELSHGQDQRGHLPTDESPMLGARTPGSSHDEARELDAAPHKGNVESETTSAPSGFATTASATPSETAVKDARYLVEGQGCGGFAVDGSPCLSGLRTKPVPRAGQPPPSKRARLPPDPRAPQATRKTHALLQLRAGSKTTSGGASVVTCPEAEHNRARLPKAERADRRNGASALEKDGRRREASYRHRIAGLEGEVACLRLALQTGDLAGPPPSFSTRCRPAHTRDSGAQTDAHRAHSFHSPQHHGPSSASGTQGRHLLSRPAARDPPQYMGRPPVVDARCEVPTARCQISEWLTALLQSELAVST